MAVPQRLATSATGSEALQVLGDLSAVAVAEILATGVTPAELIEVREWMDADAIVRAQLRHGAVDAVAAVCDILTDEDRIDEDRVNESRNEPD